jgi:hypothetical protein
LVNGKSMWRMTNAESISNSFKSIKQKEAKKVLVRVSLLCKRLIVGDGAVGPVFNRCTLLASELSKETNLENIEALEYITVLGLLGDLGYVSKTGLWRDVTDDFVITKEYVEDVVKNKSKLIVDINKALESTHML